MDPPKEPQWQLQMKPSDIYIRGRRFFAFLVPGVLWTLALTLFVLKHRHPVDVLRGVTPSVSLAAGFFAISYCVGRASGNGSLWFAQALSWLSRRIVGRAARCGAWL